MPDVAGKLSNVAQVPALPGGPGLRRLGHSVGEGLVVSPPLFCSMLLFYEIFFSPVLSICNFFSRFYFQYLLVSDSQENALFAFCLGKTYKFYGLKKTFCGC